MIIYQPQNNYIYTFVTVSVKTKLVCTSMCFEKNHILKKSQNYACYKEKIHKFLLGHYSQKENSNPLKLYNILYSPAHGKFENLGFVSVAPMVCMSLALIYDAVNVNKIVVIYPTKLPSNLRICISDYKANTIPWWICSSMGNILSQIPTL